MYWLITCFYLARFLSATQICVLKHIYEIIACSRDLYAIHVAKHGVNPSQIGHGGQYKSHTVQCTFFSGEQRAIY